MPSILVTCQTLLRSTCMMPYHFKVCNFDDIQNTCISYGLIEININHLGRNQGFNRTKASSCSILNSRTNSSHISSVNMVPGKISAKALSTKSVEIFGLAGQNRYPLNVFDWIWFCLVITNRWNGTPATATSYARYPVSPQSFYRSASLQV
ncbi:hypothetical protein BANRA_05376 [Escherichia coli]|nr:hypothetical protein BANRA_05376 [Escherichia coli]